MVASVSSARPGPRPLRREAKRRREEKTRPGPRRHGDGTGLLAMAEKVRDSQGKAGPGPGPPAPGTCGRAGGGAAPRPAEWGPPRHGLQRGERRRPAGLVPGWRRDKHRQTYMCMCIYTYECTHTHIFIHKASAPLSHSGWPSRCLPPGPPRLRPSRFSPTPAATGAAAPAGHGRGAGGLGAVWPPRRERPEPAGHGPSLALRDAPGSPCQERVTSAADGAVARF